MTAIHHTANKSRKRKISWETFEKKYLTREDGYRYEWLNGTIEKTKKMNKTQVLILTNLQDYFNRLKFTNKISGNLVAETDLFFLEHHRHPDICYFTDEQVNLLNDNIDQIPTFVIEVISNSDVAIKIAKKMDDYRAADVKTVWHIYPEQQSVHVYTGKKLKDIEIHTGEMMCSAKPGLNGYEIKTSEIFEKKK